MGDTRGSDRGQLSRFFVTVLLLALALQAGLAALRDSVTVDEVAHVAVGIAMWREGNLSLDPINPPLPRLLLALPALALGPVLDASSDLDEWQLGLALMREEPGRYHELHVAARMANIAFAVLLGWLLFRWASRRDGSTAGIIALALYVFSPTVLAHSHLATVDLAAALGYFSITAAAAAYLTLPTLGRAIGLGGAFGLAVGLKLSSLSGGCLVLGVLLAGFWRRRGDSLAARSGRSATDGLAILSSFLLVLGASYGFQGIGVRLDSVMFLPAGAFAAIAERVPSLCLPVPSGFLQGLDMLLTGNEDGARTFYLAGELSTRGWWSYHLVAYALKTPVAFLCAVLWAVATSLFGRRRPPGEQFLALAAMLVFAVNCLANPLNLGVRHLLPAEPLLCLLIAPRITDSLRRLFLERKPTTLVVGVVAAAVLASQATSAAVAAPRYLSYFNAFGGGAHRGHAWLVDSNLDWGQDLLRLREFLDRRGLESVALAYFGTVHPGVYGIRFTPIERGVTRGLAVVSPTLLVGVPSTMWRSFDRWGAGPAQEFTWLRELPLYARVGSLLVYDIP